MAAAGGLFFISPQAGAIGIVMAALAWGIGAWFDSFQRAAVLFYDLDPAASVSYVALTQAFDDLSTCRGIWHVEAGGEVRDLTTWKRNAGAAYLVRRKAAKLNYALPKVIRSNITPPSFQLGSRSLYFFPDAVFVVQGKKVGAVSYAGVRPSSAPSRFIEEGSVPGDATVVAHTWKHPNKSGGPDRRFSNNRQIPICLYDALSLQSSDVMNELLEFSRMDASRGFVTATEEIAWQVGPEQVPTEFGVPANPALPSPVMPEIRQSRPRFLRRAAVAMVGGFVGISLLGSLVDQNESPPTSKLPVSIPSQPSSPSMSTVPALPPKRTPPPPAPPINQKPAAGSANQTFYAIRNAIIRAEPSTSSQVVRGLPQGAAVISSTAENGWRRVAVDGLDGWVRSDLLSATALAPTPPTPTAAPPTLPAPIGPKPLTFDTRSSPGVVPPITPARPRPSAPSRAPYVGTCDCPYDVKRNGAMCGASSAYSRPGGRSPSCYD